MPDDREAGQHAPRSHAKFKRAPMQFQYFLSVCLDSLLAVSVLYAAHAARQP